MTEQAPITMAEARDAGYCPKGQRAWMDARVPGWRQNYLKQGVPVDVAREIHPAMVEQVLKLRGQRGQET